MSNSLRLFKPIALIYAATTLLMGCSNAVNPQLPTLSEQDSLWLGEQIFRNECNLKTECLTSWNAGETFPSLGIGHFIWFQKGQQEAFLESFPALLAFYDSEGHAIPQWIAALEERDSPWLNRESFLAAQDSEQMTQLRDFLLQTQAVQVRFIVQRMQNSLALLTQHAENPQAIGELFVEVAWSERPNGLYALIDYVNFKGEGTAEQERYKGQGWGLLQVLEYLNEHRDPYTGLLPQFVEAADFVLTRRVNNAPPERNEQRWLPGWRNRLNTYLSSAQLTARQGQ
ncbi:MAG: hypothetical protein R3332_05130 [Pseudohongiellaceae bacterium]|nr:hypothetical protein [Pseudohongiellaceae bacterium]